MLIVSYWKVINKYYISRLYLLKLISCDFFSKIHVKNFWFCPIWLFLINTTNQDHIWWTWFHVNFAEGPFYALLIVSKWILLNKYYISWSYLMDLISCGSFRRSFIKLCLINASYQQHIWLTRFHVTFLQRTVLYS